MPGQKKRTAWSVQDVVSGKANNTNPKFKSSYSGPKKTSSRVMDQVNAESLRRTGTIPRDEVARKAQGRRRIEGHSDYREESGKRYDSRMNNGSIAMNFAGSGILDYAWIVYVGILVVCLLVALLVYNSSANSYEGYRYPGKLPVFNGVINRIYEDYAKGGLGSAYNAGTDSQSEAEVDKDSLLGQNENTSALPNTTTGATMALDTGSTYGDFGIANSYDELITQLTKALEANEFGFVGMKLCYEDADSGNLIGYPQSVVEHFTQYMSDNTGKREVFLTEIKNRDEYMVKNGSAYLVKLPILKFTINMGYDNTNLSVSGFADQTMNAGQSAVVSPLLPCMYTITVTTEGGSQTSEVECDMDEGNLQVNIGVTE